MSGGEVAKILDFGICKHVAFETESPALTAVGMAVGTPLYMPPEQLLGQAVDARADVYAAGVVLFQMLAGEPPYLGTNFTELAVAHITAQIPDVRTRRPEVPAAIADAIKRAMAKEPAARFASAREFAEALAPDEPVAGSERGRPNMPSAEHVSAPRPTPSSRPSVGAGAVDMGRTRVDHATRRRGPALAIAVFTGVAAIVVGAALWWRTRGAPLDAEGAAMATPAKPAESATPIGATATGTTTTTPLAAPALSPSTTPRPGSATPGAEEAKRQPPPRVDAKTEADPPLDSDPKSTKTDDKPPTPPTRPKDPDGAKPNPYD